MIRRPNETDISSITEAIKNSSQQIVDATMTAGQHMSGITADMMAWLDSRIIAGLSIRKSLRVIIDWDISNPKGDPGRHSYPRRSVA
jgi:hypothetical protein